MTDLTQKHCLPCEGGVTPLSKEQAQTRMQDLHADWALSQDGKAISRDFRFKNYYETLAFVNALAWIAHREDHHPDLEVAYSRCRVVYSTHAIDGLSENDLICAAKADALFQ